MVEYIIAIDVTRVRFPADALWRCSASRLKKNISCSAERSRKTNLLRFSRGAGGGAREKAGGHVERHAERVWILLVPSRADVDAWEGNMKRTLFTSRGNTRFLPGRRLNPALPAANDSCGVRTHALTEWRLEPPP